MVNCPNCKHLEKHRNEQPCDTCDGTINFEEFEKIDSRVKDAIQYLSE